MAGDIKYSMVVKTAGVKGPVNHSKSDQLTS